jgi:4'-phosphopantetheinyl transferase
LNVHPSQLSFRYGRYGKPAIHKGFGEVCPHFNLSHSQEIALYAFSLNREVGIDLEYMRGDLEVAQLAEHFFLPSEVSTVSALPVHLQQEALYKCWTCKEAYLKARGEGLSLDLNLFEISLIPGKPATLLSTGGNYKETSRWTLVELPLIDNHASALAVEGDDFQIKCWQMTR